LFLCNNKDGGGGGGGCGSQGPDFGTNKGDSRRLDFEAKSTAHTKPMAHSPVIQMRKLSGY
jgi:hypothetical protein